MGQEFANKQLVAPSHQVRIKIINTVKLFKKSSITHFLSIKEFISVINRHNIYSLSSSLSYYAALALAPFLLILLKVGSLLGQDAQDELVFQAGFILGEDVAKIMEIIFSNINEGINLASISGIIGVVVLLLTVSVLFMQLRYSLDYILGDYDPDALKSIKHYVLERLFLMLVVIATAVLFFISIFISNIIKFFAGGDLDSNIMGQIILILLNYFLNVGIFAAIYYFVPSKRPKVIQAIKMGAFTSVFFIIGKILIGQYLENVAGSSVYGAAGSLLLFLVWAYYSSFIFFFSMELFLFLEAKKLKPHH